MIQHITHKANVKYQAEVPDTDTDKYTRRVFIFIYKCIHNCRSTPRKGTPPLTLGTVALSFLCWICFALYMYFQWQVKLLDWCYSIQTCSLQEWRHLRLCLHRCLRQRQATDGQGVRVPHWAPGDSRLLQCHQYYRGASQDGGEPAQYWQERVRGENFVLCALDLKRWCKSTESNHKFICKQYINNGCETLILLIYLWKSLDVGGLNTIKTPSMGLQRLQLPKSGVICHIKLWCRFSPFLMINPYYDYE